MDHTITVGLQTPDGTIAASASGLFPHTVQMQPVPESATWAMWLAALLLVPAVARRGGGPSKTVLWVELQNVHRPGCRGWRDRG